MDCNGLLELPNSPCPDVLPLLLEGENSVLFAVNKQPWMKLTSTKQAWAPSSFRKEDYKQKEAKRKRRWRRLTPF